MLPAQVRFKYLGPWEPDLEPARDRANVAAGGPREAARERQPETVRPRPARPAAPRAPGSKTAPRSSGSTPGPSSVTTKRTRRCGERRPAGPPAGVAHGVLEQRREDPLDDVAPGADAQVAGHVTRRARRARSAMRSQRAARHGRPRARRGVRPASRSRARWPEDASVWRIGRRSRARAQTRHGIPRRCGRRRASWASATIAASGVRSSCESSAEKRCSWRSSRPPIEQLVERRGELGQLVVRGPRSKRRSRSCSLHSAAWAVMRATGRSAPADDHQPPARPRASTSPANTTDAASASRACARRTPARSPPRPSRRGRPSSTTGDGEQAAIGLVDLDDARGPPASARAGCGR